MSMNHEGLIQLAYVNQRFDDIRWHSGRLLQELPVELMVEHEKIHLALAELEEQFKKLIKPAQEAFGAEFKTFPPPEPEPVKEVKLNMKAIERAVEEGRTVPKHALDKYYDNMWRNFD